MKLSRFIGVVALSLIVSGFASYACLMPAKGANPSKTTWKRYTPAKTGFSIELPGAPQKGSLPLAPDVRDKLKFIETYTLPSDRLFVMCMYGQFKDGMVLNLKNAANGAIENVKATSGVPDFKSSTQDIQFCGMPAILINATFSTQGQKFRIQQIITVKGLEMWQLCGVFLASDTSAYNDLQRIFKSTRISSQKK